MPLLLGLSLTESSAVWALVDTGDGKILAEEVVAIDSSHEIARAAARSVQAFDTQTQHDIEGIRLTWSDDARQHGIRLRTKLRLFGFETVETVSQDAAREGRNKTARHLAPHLVLAYGAARADVNTTESRRLLQDLATRVPNAVAAKMPIRLTEQTPVRVAVAAGAAVVAVAAIGLYAVMAPSPSAVPDNTAAVSTPPQVVSEVGPVADAAPPGVPIPWVDPWPVAAPAVTPAPSPAPKPVAAWLPETTVVQPEPVAVPTATVDVEVDSTAPAAITTSVGTPHLPAPHLPPGPVQLAVGPAQPPAQPAATPARPAAVAPQIVLPSPLPPALSTLFGALP